MSSGYRAHSPRALNKRRPGRSSGLVELLTSVGSGLIDSESSVVFCYQLRRMPGPLFLSLERSIGRALLSPVEVEQILSIIGLTRLPSPTSVRQVTIYGTLSCVIATDVSITKFSPEPHYVTLYACAIFM